MISIQIKGSTTGIPKREALRKEKSAKDYFEMGRTAAEAEIKKASADVKHAVADMYAAMIIAQAKALLNSTLVDIARTLGEVKAQGAMLQGFLQTQGQPPSLTPIVGNPGLAPPPLPIETQNNLNNIGLPPLPTGEPQGGGMGALNPGAGQASGPMPGGAMPPGLGM